MYREIVKAKQQHKGATVEILCYLDLTTISLAKCPQILIVLQSKNKGKYRDRCQIVLSRMFSDLFLETAVVL